ncbi:unnamed protein product, partial [Brassica oleracea]
QVSTDQRERLAMSVERLDQSSDKIRESRRTMMETEDLGVSSRDEIKLLKYVNQHDPADKYHLFRLYDFFFR